jgi:hypothetical protein
VQDRTSPSGYEHGQHRVILPIAGTDGYHWVMQTERMLADRSVRVRHTDVDNAPAGREVHWASPLRWWLGAVAATQAAVRPGLNAARSVQLAAPVANTLLLALLLVLMTPLLARWFGAIAAALFVLAWVAIFPLYELFLAGILDHHGIVAMTCCIGLVLLARGCSVQEPRWFAAAGVAWGLGMWISATTMIPVIATTGVAALLVSTLPHARPALWRTWAAAGCVTCIVAWLVEYFPGSMGLRLEVNHPLHALAWLAGGDLVVRLAQARWSSVRDRAWLAMDITVMLLPPLFIAAGGAAVFHLADPGLRAVHQQDIREFQGLLSQLRHTRIIDLLLQGSTLPALLLLPAGATLWHTSPQGRSAWRASGGAVALIGTVYLHATLFIILRALLPALAAHAIALPAAAAATVFLFSRWKAPARAAAELAQIAVIVLPAAMLLALALLQVRWFSIGVAAVLPLVVIAPRMRCAGVDSARATRLATAYLLALLIPLPLLSALIPWRFGYPAAADLPQIATRHVAHALRSEHGAEPLVFAAPATTTTWLVWFAGGRGVGTLYWENSQGLNALAAIFDAPDADSAYTRLTSRRITHLVVPSWEGRPPRWLNPASPPPWLRPLDLPPTASAIRLPDVAVFRVLAAPAPL